MKRIRNGGSGEIVEKKSRFIANVFSVDDEETAVRYINEVKKKYWDARHNCSAYVIGDKNELQRFSDDGEPSGTAGKPILEIIDKSGVHNCLIVVTRYFGGTLLGTGGLIRAYQASAKAGLDASVTQFTLTEGRNRQIRKMCEKCSLTIMRLTRIAVGKLRLGELERGKWRELTKNEVDYLLGKSDNI